jgi:D-glycero-alpha-D-manno-heptose-7-phosphate kinase
MIITKTPFRVTLGGGGTDLPSFYGENGGFILAVAIDKYMFLNVNTPILDDSIRVQYSRTEVVNHVDDVQHALASRMELRWSLSPIFLRAQVLVPPVAMWWDC